MRKFTVYLLTCAFSALLITELSTALIVQSHSQQIQINEEDTLEIGIKTPINWFYRQFVFGTYLISRRIIDPEYPVIGNPDSPRSSYPAPV